MFKKWKLSQNSTDEHRPTARSTSKWDLVRSHRQSVSKTHSSAKTTEKVHMICPHDASPVYGCAICGLPAFSLPAEQKYEIWVPVADKKAPIHKPSVFGHWWGMDLSFPTPTVGNLHSGSSLLFASVSFAGGLATLFLPGAGIALGTVASWMVVQNSWIRMVDRGYGVNLRFLWSVPIFAIPTPLPPPIIEVKESDEPLERIRIMKKLLDVKKTVKQRLRYCDILFHPIVLMALSSFITAYAVRKYYNLK